MRKRTNRALAFAGSLLLTLACSFSALAFTGWVEEDDGTTVYLDSSGQRVTDTWMRRGSSQCYLDENGEVAKNQFVDYNGHDCYLDENGSIAKNKWVSALNTDEECDQEVNILWYYFDKKGYMAKDNRTSWFIDASPKQAGNYFFDEDGHMKSGWVDITDWDGNTETYYLGEGDDGRMRTEWQRLEPREDTEPEDRGKSYDPQVWYYFNWDGKQIKDQEKRINRSYYQFDPNGVMMTGWYPGVFPEDEDWAINSYYDPNSGARVEGWFYSCEQDDYDEAGERFWYYQNKKGEVFNEGGRDAGDYSQEEGATIAIKHLGSCYYGFDSRGRMVTGLIDTRQDRSGNNEDLMQEEFEDTFGAVASTTHDYGEGIFYFEDRDGSRLGQMGTGKKKLDDISGSVEFLFRDNGQAYVAAMVDGKVYDLDGRLLRGDRQTEIMSVPYDIYKKNASEEDEPVIPYGESFIVTSSGKVKRSGKVTVDGTKYLVENYIVVKVLD